MSNKTTGSAAVALRSSPGRLHAVLVSIVDTSDYDAKQTGYALATAVGIAAPERRTSWYIAASELMTLLGQAAKETAADLPEFARSPHARTYQAITAVLDSSNLEVQWHQTRQQLAHVVTIALPFVAHAAELKRPAVTLPAVRFDEIRQDLDRLLSLILGSDLPAELKQELAYAFEQLRDRIVRIQVFGAEGVARATANLVGTLTMNEGEVASHAEVMSKAVDLITKVQDAILKAFGIGKLAARAFEKLLGTGITS